MADWRQIVAFKFVVLLLHAKLTHARQLKARINVTGHRVSWKHVVSGELTLVIWQYYLFVRFQNTLKKTEWAQFKLPTLMTSEKDAGMTLVWDRYQFAFSWRNDCCYILSNPTRFFNHFASRSFTILLDESLGKPVFPASFISWLFFKIFQLFIQVWDLCLMICVWMAKPFLHAKLNTNWAARWIHMVTKERFVNRKWFAGNFDWTFHKFKGMCSVFWCSWRGLDSRYRLRLCDASNLLLDLDLSHTSMGAKYVLIKLWWPQNTQ